MKLKRIILSLVTGVALLLLVGCGSSAKKEFVDSMYSNTNKDFNAAKFDMKIEDFTFNTSDSSGSAYANMIANQLKGVKIDGSYAMDDKEAYEMEMNLHVLGQKIPVQLVGKKEKIYLSTSLISSAIDLANAFQLPLNIAADDLKQLEGKYIDLAETGKTLADEKATDDNPLKNINPSTANNEKLNSELKKLIESFDNDSFKKEGDEITHTFTKKELIQIMEEVDKIAKEDKEYKNSESEKQVKQAIASFKNDIDTFDIKVTINQKSHEVKSLITMAVSEDKSKKDNMSLTFSMTVKPQKNEQTIKMPDQKNILTQAQINELFNDIQSSTTATESDDADLDATATEEEFNELIKQIKENADLIDEETAEAFRSSGEVYFNEEQMKELNKVLDEVLNNEKTS